MRAQRRAPIIPQHVGVMVDVGWGSDKEVNVKNKLGSITKKLNMHGTPVPITAACFCLTNRITSGSLNDTAGIRPPRTAHTCTSDTHLALQQVPWAQCEIGLLTV